MTELERLARKEGVILGKREAGGVLRWNWVGAHVGTGTWQRMRAAYYRAQLPDRAQCPTLFYRHAGSVVLCQSS